MTNYFYTLFLSKYFSDSTYSTTINYLLAKSENDSMYFNQDFKSILVKFTMSMSKELSQLDVETKSQLNIQYHEKMLTFIENLVNVKFSSKTYDLNIENVFDYYTNLDPKLHNFLKNLINASKAKTENIQTVFNSVINNIDTYFKIIDIKNEVKAIESISHDSDSKSVLNVIEDFNTIVAKLNNKLNSNEIEKLKLSKNDEDTLTFSTDKSEINKLTDRFYEFYSNKFNLFTTGYVMIDDPFGGLESGGIYLIPGQTNHGKSLFAINLLNNIIKHWIPSENKKQIFLYITLEDNKYKAFRRFVSVFGNYPFSQVKQFFNSYSMMTYKNGQIKKYDDKKINDLGQEFKNDLSNLMQKSIFNNLGNNKLLGIHSGAGKGFSSNDLLNLITNYEKDGVEVAMVVIDYLDVMTGLVGKSKETYEKQGDIVNELRGIANSKAIPIIIPTQLKRSDDKFKPDHPFGHLVNSAIGDSYLKARFSDYIFMINKFQKADFDFYNKEFCEHIVYDNTVIDLALYPITPFGMKCTKAKDGEVDMYKYMIMSNSNLRIYDTAVDFSGDLATLSNNSDYIKNLINKYSL